MRGTVTRASTGPRGAFSLMEMLVVMAALSLVTLVAGAVLYAAFRTERAEAAALRRLNVQAVLADRFRADVAGANDAPEKLNELAAGPGCLILRGPAGPVIYRWDGKVLERFEVGAPGGGRQVLDVGDGAGAEFARADGGRLLTLRILQPLTAGGTRPAPPVEITAALGGDLR